MQSQRPADLQMVAAEGLPEQDLPPVLGLAQRLPSPSSWVAKKMRCGWQVKWKEVARGGWLLIGAGAVVLQVAAVTVKGEGGWGVAKRTFAFS